MLQLLTRFIVAYAAARATAHRELVIPSAEWDTPKEPRFPESKSASPARCPSRGVSLITPAVTSC